MASSKTPGCTISRMLALLHRLLMKVRPAFLSVLLKKLFQIRRIVVNGHRGRFFVDPVSNLGNAVITFGEYEPDMFATLEGCLRESDTFVDVGANEGYFSVAAAKLVGPDGCVFAIEPQRRLGPIIHKNAQLNDLKNIFLVTSAVSSESGMATLHLSPNTNTGSTSLHKATRYALPTEAVPVDTLSGIFRSAEIRRADLMKMDIESYEYEAILGSPDLFVDHLIQVLALELHPVILRQRGRDPREVEHFLQSCGYRRLERFKNLVWALGTR